MWTYQHTGQNHGFISHSKYCKSEEAETTSQKIQMVGISNIPLEEIQLVNNVLEKHCFHFLNVWYVCNDSMIEYHWNDLSQLVFP